MSGGSSEGEVSPVRGTGSLEVPSVHVGYPVGRDVGCRSFFLNLTTANEYFTGIFVGGWPVATLLDDFFPRIFAVNAHLWRPIRDILGHRQLWDCAWLFWTPICDQRHATAGGALCIGRLHFVFFPGITQVMSFEVEVLNLSGLWEFRVEDVNCHYHCTGPDPVLAAGVLAIRLLEDEEGSDSGEG